jgi:WD40 repeat protein
VTPQQWREVDTVLAAALELPQSEQHAWVARQCAGRPELQAEVESLLRAHRAAGEFIEPLTNEGRRIGPYRLLEAVGVGGMGTVYLAEREDRRFQQRVAIKLMAAGLELRPEAVRRFLEERQILAGLAHPNIARLLDGGYLAEGTPYIVMEYIEGMPITVYCDRHGIDLRARLRLFLQLTDGVRYAHQHLVIHRDLKPANILVTGEGVVKLLDFGIAKLLDQDAGRTQTIAQAMTPDYASPEQIRGETITTASDVYCLGVLLFELLTGRRPYRLSSQQPLEIERVICEQQPESPGISADLDNIILMGLRKEPQRRYVSVEQFSNDIVLYLKDLPVIARKDTWAYRSAKFVRRHRLGVLAASMAAVSLLTGTIAATWQAHRADLQRVRAEQQETENRRLLYAAQMNLAYQAWDMANTGRVLALLNAQRPGPGREDLRGFAWSYLWRLSHGELFTLQNPTPVSSVAFSIEAKVLLVAGQERMVRRWDLTARQELPALPVAIDFRKSAFTPDGRILALSSSESVILWDTATNQQVADLTGFSSLIYAVAISPDGKTLAAGMSDNTVELWDVAARRKLRTLTGHTYSVYSVAFSPDGRWLASGPGAGDTSVVLWDLTTGRRRANLRGHTGAVSSLRFSADSKTLASGSWDTTARLWDVATGKSLGKLQGHSNYVRSVAFSPDGRILATGSSDSTAKLWEVATNNELATLKGHTDYISSLLFSPDGATLVSGGFDGTIKLWDVPSYLKPSALIGRAGPVHAVVFSPDGKLIASANHDMLKLWNVRSGQEIPAFSGPTSPVSCVAWSARGGILATGGSDHTVRLWDVAARKELAVLQGHRLGVRTLEFSPEGATLATGSLDGTIKLWDVASRREVGVLAGEATTEVGSLTISPDGRRLAAGYTNGTVTLWDMAMRQRLFAYKGHRGPVNDVRFSPDGKTLASAGWDRTVKLWDVTVFREKDSFQGNANELSCLAFSPDGKTLATGGGDRTVKLWDAATRQELATLKGHTNLVSSVAFSPDGKTLASASYDGTVRLWQAGSYKTQW